MLNIEEISDLKQNFLNKRAVLIAQLQAIPDTPLYEDTGDEADIVQSLQMNCVSSSLSKRSLESISRIDSALAKIEQGSFGQCEECEEKIEVKRLIALPYCKLCISCQEITEMQAKQKR